MSTSEDARRRWNAARRLSAGVLFVWFVVTFGVAYFARAFATSALGSAWGFWMAAEGAPLLYLALVGVYAWRMNRLDERVGVVEHD